MKWLIKEERGAALVVVLIAFVVVSILGFALLNISGAETRFAEHQKDKTQAYYIAHSGADAVATYIIKNPDGLSDSAHKAKVDALIATNSDATSLSGGSFTVDVEAVGTTGIRVNSTGTFDGVTQNVSINILKRGLFENAIYAHKNLVLWSGAKVYGGDVQYGESYSEANNAEIIGGEAIPGKLDYPENEFPTLGWYTGVANADLTIGNGSSITANGDSDVTYLEKEYDQINISNHGEMIINLEGETKRIIVSEMTVNGTLTINGPGKLLLYVRDAVYFKGIINSQAENLVVFIGDYDSATGTGSKGYCELKTGNALFNGYIVGIYAEIDITSNLVYKGAIIAETVKVASNAGLYYDKDLAATIIPSEIYLPGLGYKFESWSD